MIYILGSGYLGRAYARYFSINSIQYKLISRKEVMYTNPVTLAAFLNAAKPSLLINAAGAFRADPENAENHKLSALYGNAILPGCIGELCNVLNINWIHNSSTCMYTASQDEEFYKRSIEMGEELIEKYNNVWVCRPGRFISEISCSKNYLTQLSIKKEIRSGVELITDIDEYVKMCYDLYRGKAPFRKYNFFNPSKEYYTTNEHLVFKLSKSKIRTTEVQWCNTQKSLNLLRHPEVQAYTFMTDSDTVINNAINNWTITT